MNSMETSPVLSVQMLDEDLQIVRATLATLSDDVARICPAAGGAFNDAIEKIEQAHSEILRADGTRQVRGDETREPR